MKLASVGGVPATVVTRRRQSAGGCTRDSHTCCACVVRCLSQSGDATRSRAARCHRDAGHAARYASRFQIYGANTEDSRNRDSRASTALSTSESISGQLVRAGQTLFLIDPKPFEAVLQFVKGQLGQQQARLVVTKANLARVIPPVAQNAVSKKDAEDATGNENQSETAVIAAQGLGHPHTYARRRMFCHGGRSRLHRSASVVSGQKRFVHRVP